MLYWYDRLAAGELDIQLEGMAYATELLYTYDNVDIHYFQDMPDWISNLDNYADTVHFSKEITDEITYRLCNGSHLVTPENYEARLEIFENFLKEFDYTTILP